MYQTAVRTSPTLPRSMIRSDYTEATAFETYHLEGVSWMTGSLQYEARQASFTRSPRPTDNPNNTARLPLPHRSRSLLAVSLKRGRFERSRPLSLHSTLNPNLIHSTVVVTITIFLSKRYYQRLHSFIHTPTLPHPRVSLSCLTTSPLSHLDSSVVISLDIDERFTPNPNYTYREV